MADALPRQARRFVAASVAFLVCWQVATLLGAPRDALVVLGVYGFALHMVFGKAYSLVPSYFARSPPPARAPAIQLPLTLGGTLALAGTTSGVLPPAVAPFGALAWLAGVVVFVGALAWTLRSNLTGAETGTSDANAARRRVDRWANAFVPVALAYLLAGSYETLASVSGLPGLVGGSFPRTAHLLAAGAAGTFVFAVGFRLLPRFLVARAPRPLVGVVLPAGAVGPLLIAAFLPVGPFFEAGAAVEATAVVGFAAAYAVLFLRSDRRRVGFYGVLAGSLSGVLGVLLGLWFAAGGIRAALVAVHFRLNVLGFLGLTVVGVAYQFYPPNVGRFRGASDRTALASIAALASGLLVELVGVLADASALVLLGHLLALAGSLLYAYLVLGLFAQEYWAVRLPALRRVSE